MDGGRGVFSNRKVTKAMMRTITEGIDEKIIAVK